MRLNSEAGLLSLQKTVNFFRVKGTQKVDREPLRVETISSTKIEFRRHFVAKKRCCQGGVIEQIKKKVSLYQDSNDMNPKDVNWKKRICKGEMI